MKITPLATAADRIRLTGCETRFINHAGRAATSGAPRSISAPWDGSRIRLL